MAKYRKVQGTDSKYDILHDGDTIGSVWKVWTGRSTSGWAAYPDDCPEMQTRILHDTRAEARDAVLDFLYTRSLRYIGMVKR